ncbi:MAG: FecR domain-containing protein [Verrucomicrobiota bacterium]|jgi:ferric-dicitrate binding protein FerR (iron transport regulator)
MKRTKLILVCGLVLALTGLTTLLVAAGAQKDQKAIVRSVVGDVQYQVDGMGPFLALRVNMELNPKTVLKSGRGASAYLQVNGVTSVVKLTENTTVTLSTMTATGPGLDADKSTDLKLDGGTILGQVKKLSANSDYKVTVPNGVAGIRGTDFQVTVTVQNGTVTVTFTSQTGTIFCQVTPAAGQTQEQSSRTLTSGQSWTVTGTVPVAGGPVTTVSLGIVGTVSVADLATFRTVFNPPPVIVTTVTVTPTAPPPPPVHVPVNNNPSTVGGS